MFDVMRTIQTKVIILILNPTSTFMVIELYDMAIFLTTRNFLIHQNFVAAFFTRE